MTDTDVSRPLNDAMAALRDRRFADVEPAARAVLELDPENAHAQHALGLALAQLNRHDEAIAALRRSVELAPEAAGYHANLAAALWSAGHTADALKHFDRTVALEPRNGGAWQTYAEALFDAGDAAAAVHAYANAARYLPPSTQLRSRMLRALIHAPPTDAGALAKIHDAFGKAVAAPTTITSHPNAPIPDRTLRVGYVLSTLTSLAPFLEPILARHDPDQVEAVIYVDAEEPAGTLARLREQVTRYRHTSELSNADLAAAIRADEIDILVDLAGHLGRRAALFAEPLAPVHLAYAGYPAASGSRTIAHRITDTATPATPEEPILRLAPCALTYRPPRSLPEPSPLPAMTTKRITFGVLAPPACMTREAILLWGRAIAGIENAQLLVHLPTPAHQAAAERIRSTLDSAGLLPPGLRFETDPDRLPLYERIDLALDSFPLSDPATVCEALWMGVPTLALASVGELDARTASILSAAGLPDFIARDAIDFAAIAKRIGSAPVQLAALRRTLRLRLRSSELLKESSLTRRLEAAFRAAWRGWCEGRPLASGTVFQTPQQPAAASPPPSFFDEIPYQN